MNRLEKVGQASRHNKRAASLLRRAMSLQETAEDGLIEKCAARNAALKLNEQAIEEAVEASRLIKEFLCE